MIIPELLIPRGGLVQDPNSTPNPTHTPPERDRKVGEVLYLSLSLSSFYTFLSTLSTLFFLCFVNGIFFSCPHTILYLSFALYSVQGMEYGPEERGCYGKVR